MKFRHALVLVALLLSTTVIAAAADLPPGKWWRRQDVVDRLKISEEQQVKLDGIFRISANELIDLKADVEKRSIALRGELDQPQLNREAIRKQAAHLSDARARLFDRELAMLVDMRGVLSDEQWREMRAILDNMNKDVLRPRAGRGMMRKK